MDVQAPTDGENESIDSENSSSSTDDRLLNSDNSSDGYSSTSFSSDSMDSIEDEECFDQNEQISFPSQYSKGCDIDESPIREIQRESDIFKNWICNNRSKIPPFYNFTNYLRFAKNIVVENFSELMLVVLLYALFDYINITDSKAGAILMLMKIFCASTPVTYKTFCKLIHNLYRFPTTITYSFCNKCEKITTSNDRCDVRIC
jgi:hypothetical protein